MARALIAACAAASLLSLASPATPATPAPGWDGLVPVNSRQLDQVFLAPGADFRGYTKVMLDPTEVSFARNWQRDFNRSTAGLSNRISDAEARTIADQVRTGFEQVFATAYTNAGFAVVTEPGPDVLRMRTAITDLSVTAPDQMNSQVRRTLAPNAGQATVVIEARDSLTGALLGRAVDRRTAGRAGTWVRNRVTNRADFERMFNSWAQASVNGLAQLRSMSPVLSADR